MNFWSVINVQKYYNCINPSLSTVKKFYAMLHYRYYGSTALCRHFVGVLPIISEKKSDAYISIPTHCVISFA